MEPLNAKGMLMKHCKQIEKGSAKARALDRRAVLTRLAAPVGLALPVAILSAGAAPVHAKIEAIPAASTPAEFMAQAERMRQLALASGDRGYGAVVVKDGRIVGQSPSRVVTKGDPTAHAEMEAIRDAARNLKTQDLSDCVLYSTSRACPMCEAAASWAQIKDMRFGSSLSDAGVPQLGRC